MLQAAPAPAGRRAARLVPGLAVVVGLAALALAASALLPGVVAASVAVALGALLGSSGLHHAALRPGTRAAGHHLLRGAVVLLGLEVAVPDVVRLGGPGLVAVAVTVAVTFTGTRLLGRLLGVPAPQALLVATGFSICGASAVAGMRDAARAEDEDAAVAVGLVTLCGTTAIVVLPLLRGPLGLDPAAFGAWVGASVQDVGQTVAVAQQVPGALHAAVVVKLSRVVLLAPLVAGVALARRRADAARPAEARGTGSLRRPPLVPGFVVGFLAAVAVASSGLLPGPLLAAAGDVRHVVTVAALVGLGTGIDVRALRRTAGRATALGLLSWALVATTSLAALTLAARVGAA
ncbi:YeiH family protein [Kineosporia sp. A_224]|uniref:YeiH family protein n=1 Tax=Kineosporia sp. A_224 TaxID=1962180 RepID=UPI000B4B9240|nr:putative sulfate exporter family transporter [Kineosporia sp. A_224]